jgi:membrane-bound lytic murein transglycosylase B
MSTDGWAVGPVPYLEKRLKANGFPQSFIQLLLKNYDASKRDQVVKLNVMGFLLSPDYSTHTSPDGIQKCREFINAHSGAFQKAEKSFGVKKEIIASLLWVESRLGDNHGNFHVASVYLSLLLGEHPELIQVLLEDLKKRVPNPNKALIAKTKNRARIKSRWAIGELWALYKMNKANSTVVRDLKGSYSGAFGYSQFLPSSFVTWAKSYSGKRPPDLYNPDDAIVSVGNYLNKNGYKRGKEQSYRKALFMYNKSKDYGDTIIKLAMQVNS